MHPSAAGEPTLTDDPRQTWIGHGLSTAPADRDRAELGSWEAVELAGARLTGQVPIWVRSPLAGVLASAYVGFAFGDALAQRAMAPVLAATDTAAGRAVRQSVDAAVWPVRMAIHQQVCRELETRGPDFDRLRDEIRMYAWNRVWEVIGDPVYSQGWEQKSVRSGGLFEQNLPNWTDALLEGQFGAGVMAAVDSLDGVDTAPFSGIRRATDSCSWWWLWKSCAVFCERPSVIDVRGERVHVEFRDGWTVDT